MSSTSSVFDPRISLATSVHAQPGVYALLLGSGTSTGAGVPTGWGVITDLVTRAAVAAGDDVTDNFDPEQWWHDHGDGTSLGYSGLLDVLAPTAGARKALLAGFFEATDDDRDNGRKVPGPAHQAVAELVRRGSVRVILTTNFDRLAERAVEAVGVSPQVIASPSAIAGMEPLAHSRCTIIKLHGDYTRLDQLNTVNELSTYDTDLNQLLERVLDEYGLIVNGWSADWDHALVAAIEGTRSRRYPLYWSSYGVLGDAAKRLVALHRAQVVSGVTADQFFPDLVDRLGALDALVDAPLTRAMAVARLKRLLPDPVRHIELRDLLAGEVDRLRMFLADRGQTVDRDDPARWQEVHDDIARRCDTLMHLVATGVYLDRDRHHDDLWVWIVEQLLRARQHPDGHFRPDWMRLGHYPALLVAKAAGLAAVGAGRDDILLRILRKPTWRDIFKTDQQVTALDALHDNRVLDHELINSFPRWSGTRWLYPASHLLKEQLKPILMPLIGDEYTYVTLYHRLEYRTAVALWLAREQGLRSGPASGEFIGDGQWQAGPPALIWESEFRQHADRAVWDWPAVNPGETDPFSEQLTALGETLEKNLRRFG
jgi:hypothetical protein